MSKRVYPDPDRLRRQSKLACRAIQELADMRIQVLGVKFRNTNPKIEVANCPATRKLRSAGNGQGIDNDGNFYLSRVSIFCGCQVEWHEVQ